MSTNKSKKAEKVQRYFIKGMHCSSCELLIKQNILNLEGIQDVKVSLTKSQVTIYAKAPGKIPSAEHLNSLFQDLGYSFHNDEQYEKDLAKGDIQKVLLITGIFALIFYAFEKSNIFMRFSINPNSTPLGYFLFGIAAGISSCAALVGGLLLSLSKKWNTMYNGNKTKSILPFIYFNASRIATFAIFGGILGYLGSMFTVSIQATAVVTVLIAALMLVVGFQMIGIKWFHRFNLNLTKNNRFLDKNQEVQGKYLPAIVGAMTFFVPCGFTLVAQGTILTTGNFWSGFVNLLAFSLGTLPILAVISFSSVKFYSNPVASKRFSLLSGALIVFFAFYAINSQLNVLGLKSLNDISFSKESSPESLGDAIGDSKYQVIQMDASGFEYYPRQISIKSGVKTRWEINNKGAVGCAQAVYGPGLYPEVIYLKSGMNSVEFIAPKPGIYKISCSMGMVTPVIVKVI